MYDRYKVPGRQRGISLPRTSTERLMNLSMVLMKQVQAICLGDIALDQYSSTDGHIAGGPDALQLEESLLGVQL